MSLTHCPSCWNFYDESHLADHATPCNDCGSTFHPSCLCPKKRATK